MALPVLNSEIRWPCQACGQRIGPLSGGLYVDRRRAEEIVRAWKEPVEHEPGGQLDWSVVHHRCFTGEHQTVQVFVDDVSTVLELMEATAGMAEDLWLYATDWPTVLALALGNAKPDKVYPTVEEMFADLEADDRDEA